MSKVNIPKGAFSSMALNDETEKAEAVMNMDSNNSAAETEQLQQEPSQYEYGNDSDDEDYGSEDVSDTDMTRVGKWVPILFVQCLYPISLIALIIYAIASKDPVKKAWARAELIIAVIAIIVAVAMVVVLSKIPVTM